MSYEKLRNPLSISSREIHRIIHRKHTAESRGIGIIRKCAKIYAKRVRIIVSFVIKWRNTPLLPCNIYAILMDKRNKISSWLCQKRGVLTVETKKTKVERNEKSREFTALFRYLYPTAVAISANSNSAINTRERFDILFGLLSFKRQRNTTPD